MKKSLFAKLLIVILCLSLVLCGCKKSGQQSSAPNSSETKKETVDTPATPEEIASASLSKTLSAMFGGEGDLGLLESKMDYSKITLAVGEYVDNVLYIDNNKMQMVDELNVNIDELQVEAGIYLNENELVLTLPGLVEGAYGVKLDTLAEDLENSELLALLGIDYDEVKDELGGALDDVVQATDSLGSYTVGLESAVENALGNVDKKVSEGKVTVDGQEVDAIIVTYALDSEGLLKMIDALGTGFADYLEQLESLDQTSSSFYFNSPENFTGKMEDALSELKSVLAEIDLNSEVVVNINADTGYIMTVEGNFEGKEDGETSAVTLDINLGVNAAESDKYTLTVGAVEDGEEMDAFQMVLKRDITDVKDSYELTLKAAGMELGSVALVYDKNSGEYTFNLEADGNELGVTGVYKLSDKALEFSVASVNVDGDKTEVNAKIVVEKVSADSIPKTPKYKNILKLSQQEFIVLFSELSEVMEQFNSAESEPDYVFDEEWAEYDI